MHSRSKIVQSIAAVLFHKNQVLGAQSGGKLTLMVAREECMNQHRSINTSFS